MALAFRRACSYNFCMSDEYFLTDISARIWDSKYRFRDHGEIRDLTVVDTWRRIARALASVENSQREAWAQRFYSVLEGFRFLPGGRIQAGAGTPHKVTLFNCFVMGPVEDSLNGIFDALKEGALTMQQGGGVGYDFSTLRPRGQPARGVGTVASGPVSFMRIWDSMCATILSSGARRGAMMATLRCDHPDIEDFIEAKRSPQMLRHFNLSVLVSDEFMQALAGDKDWPLVFPLPPGDEPSGDIVYRAWSGADKPLPCRVLRRVRARALWDRIMRATYDYAEPGVIFIDRINRLNNLWYCEHVSATNPCGEVPLPPYGACDLGSLNLTAFVRAPFRSEARLDQGAIRDTAAVAVRMLDNVYELSGFPLPQQAQTARGTRRLGLGLTGLADALIMLGIPYGSDKSIELAGQVMQTICHSAYRSSVALAREKGAFPKFDADKYLQGEFIRTLPADILEGIRGRGIRNSHLTAIAPTGTISLLANNISSGLEPVYEFSYWRRVREADSSLTSFKVADYAYSLFRRERGEQAELTPAFVRAADVEPDSHLAVQAALQRYVDNSISKTVNVPEGFGFEAFRGIYEQAHKMGLKGCTAFRPNPVTGQVMVAEEGVPGEKQCCFVDREVGVPGGA